MKVQQLKLTVFISLIVSFILSIVVLFYYFKKNLIDFETPEAPNEFMLIVKKVIGIFSVQISVAIASYFGATYKASSQKANERHYIAFSLIILWSIGFLLYLFLNGNNLSQGNIKFNDIYKDIDTLTVSFNFLISAAIVFLFMQVPAKQTR